jgi:pimeloyl-ACP methyl ester carboxylesterase
MLEKRYVWADVRSGFETVFSKDDLCDTASIDWFTRTYASSSRYYANAVRDPWRPRHDRLPRVEVPTAVSVFTEDVRRPPRAWVERYYDLRQWRIYDRGGHFTPFERPDAFVADVRDFYRTLR